MADDTGGTASATPAAGSSPAPSTAPASSTPAASTPTSATATSADASAAASSEPGPIPYARFKEVNDSLKTAKAFQDKFGWASQFETEPYSFVENWIDQLAAHPQYQQQLMAKAARMLQSRRGASQQPQVAEEPAPDVPIVDGQGNVTGQTYSAAALKKWHEWSWAQRETQLSERLQPLEQMRTSIEQQQQRQALQAQATEAAQQTVGKLKQSPVFVEHKDAFAQFFEQHEEYGDDVKGAWWDFYSSTVLPTLSRTEQAKVLTSLQKQAASGTVNPGASAPTGPPKFKDFGEAIKYFDAHPEEAAAMAKR